MKILVTGASGFLGSYVMAALKSDKRVNKVVGVSRKASSYPWDINDSDMAQMVNCDVSLEVQVASLLNRYRPDAIFHYAANPLVREQGTVQTAANVVSTHNLLRHAPKGCRFVLASSATVYGNNAGRGDWVSEHCPFAPNSVYGATKVAAEAMVDAYDRLGLVNGLSLRYVACVGPGATHGLVPDLVRKLKSDSPTLDLLGDEPGARKPFLLVDDAASAAVHLGLRIQSRRSVNVCPHDAITVAEAADVVMDTLNIRKPVRWLGEGANWAGDNRTVKVSNYLALRSGWMPKFDKSADAIVDAVRRIEMGGNQ